MKGIAPILAFLFSLAFSGSFAQPAVVKVGDIPANTFKDGKMSLEVTTRDRIIKAGKLVARPDCEIVSYTFSLAKGDQLFGMVAVKGAQFPDKVINELKETMGPGISVLFDDIKVKQDGIIRAAHPIALRYDQ